MTRPRPEGYVAVNPLAGIPTLVDGDLALSESNAILRYLAARQGRDDLYPADLVERARVDELLDRFATRFRAAFFRVEAPALGFVMGAGWGAEARDPAAVAAAEREIAPELALLDGLVRPEGAVIGRFTIADCALAPVLFRTTRTGLDLGPYPRLAGLRDGLLARPAWAAAEAVT